jgi:Uma2 family endonuclease
LRQKPGMTTEHNEVISRLVARLVKQLPEEEFAVRVNSTRLRVSTGSYYVPDVLVIPRSLILRPRQQPGRLEVYDEPLPLVVEVWSPSTGDYDVDTKLRDYQLRGDNEIWRIHPYERTVTIWRRQPAGDYVETVHRTGFLRPASLSTVRIEVESLFD